MPEAKRKPEDFTHREKKRVNNPSDALVALGTDRDAGADYEQLPRSALIRLLQEHNVALGEAGRDGIVMSYTGRTAPWQIIRLVKPKLSRIC